MMKQRRFSQTLTLVTLPTLTLILAALILAAADPSSRVEINPARRFQTINGFGVNFNGAYFRDSQKPMLDMLVDDLGATLFRLDAYGFDLSDWEPVNDNDDPQVMNWEYYNDRYSIPNFEASWGAGRYLNSKGATVLLAVIGRIPEWMLDTKASPPKHRVCRNKPEPCKPDHLNPAMYEEYAEMLVSMAMYARNRAHVKFELFSPFNETDCYPSEGPRIDPDEVPAVLEAITRRLEKEGLGDVKLVTAEQANVTNDYIGPILQNGALMKRVGAFAFHTYGEESVGTQVARIFNSGYPKTHVWLTEYGDLNDRDRSPASEWKNQCLKASERVLRALTQGANAAFFWDAFDNFEMCELRPSFYGLMRNDDHRYSPKKRYYSARQLYRFVRPGSVRIEAVTSDPRIAVSAFLSPAGDSIAVFGIKKGGVRQIDLVLDGADPVPAEWELYQTTPNLNCEKTGTYKTVDGTARLDLADEAIFTAISRRRRP